MNAYIFLLCVYSASGALDCNERAIVERVESREACVRLAAQYRSDKRVRPFCVAAPTKRV